MESDECRHHDSKRRMALCDDHQSERRLEKKTSQKSARATRLIGLQSLIRRGGGGVTSANLWNSLAWHSLTDSIGSNEYHWSKCHQRDTRTTVLHTLFLCLLSFSVHFGRLCRTIFFRIQLIVTSCELTRPPHPPATPLLHSCSIFLLRLFNAHIRYNFAIDCVCVWLVSVAQLIWSGYLVLSGIGHYRIHLIPMRLNCTRTSLPSSSPLFLYFIISFRLWNFKRHTTRSAKKKRKEKRTIKQNNAMLLAPQAYASLEVLEKSTWNSRK